MQAVIMAGGKGTRLASVTKNEIPKPMVQLAGKPLLQRQVEQLKADGIMDIIMVIGHLGQVIEDYFGDGEAYGVRISYIREQEPLGTAGSFYELGGMLSGRYFLLVFGDVYFSIDIEKMERFHQERQAKATLFVHPNGHPEDSDLVVLDKKTARVTNFISKHSPREGVLEDCVNAGFYILDRSVCGMVQKQQKTDLEKDILLPLVMQDAGVYGYYSMEYIKDIGTAQRTAQVQEDLFHCSAGRK